MEIIGIELEEDDRCGVIVQAKEVKRKGHAPLCDLEAHQAKRGTAGPSRNICSGLQTVDKNNSLDFSEFLTITRGVNL